MNKKDEAASVTLSATDDGGQHAGLERADELGRYIVLGQIGAGGMGVVYLAYDPDLDRKVAVKVVQPDAGTDEARLLREARAMARVQHLNVIAVHDVGITPEGVFIAMELIEGMTLARWLDERKADWRAIVDVYVQAGRGLAAAHAVGLVHRDFKPTNVLVGADGRARVGDFGLARSTAPASASASAAENEASSAAADVTAQPLDAVTRTGRLVGTPSYMSPEQLLGEPFDARSDQFSFSVALYRALFGERPFAGESMAEIAAEIGAGRLRQPPRASRVPPWLQKVVLRGLSVRAEDRWPSMDAMLAALQRDPDRIRRRRLVGGGVIVGLAALAAVVPMTRRGAQLCRGSQRELAGVWDGPARARVHAAFVASGHPDGEETFSRVAGALDGWAAEFVGAHVDACEATRVRHELSGEALDLRMACLDRRADEVKAQVDLFAAADRKLVERATRMVGSLPSVSMCSDVAALRATVPVPADKGVRATIDGLHKELARGVALTAAAKFDEAAALLERALSAATSTGYRPIEGEAAGDLGFVELQRGKLERAEKLLFEAVEADRAGRDAVDEVFCWTHLVHAAADQGRYDEAQRRGRYAMAAFEASGMRDQRPLARLLLAMGTADSYQGRFAEALAEDRRALAIREAGEGGGRPSQLGEALEDVAAVLNGLGRYDEAEPYIRRALAQWERESGRDSPFYASSLFNLALTLVGQGHYDAALVEYRKVIDIWERKLGKENPRLVLALTNTGDVLRSLHRYDEALVYDRRALALAEKTKGPDHRDVGLALNNLADVLRLRHDDDEALADYRRAIAIWQAKLTADHPYFVAAWTGIGEIDLDRKQPARALVALDKAAAIAEKHADDPLPLAEVRFALARAEWDGGRDHGRARERAVAARGAFAAARNQGEELAAVDAWLTTHRP